MMMVSEAPSLRQEPTNPSIVDDYRQNKIEVRAAEQNKHDS